MTRGYGIIVALILLVVISLGVGMAAYGQWNRVLFLEQTLQEANRSELIDKYKNQDVRKVVQELDSTQKQLDTVTQAKVVLEEQKSAVAKELETQTQLVGQLKGAIAEQVAKVGERDKTVTDLQEKLGRLQQDLTKENPEIPRLKNDLADAKIARQKADERAAREQAARLDAEQKAKKNAGDLQINIDRLQKAIAELQNVQSRREESKKELYDGKVLEVDVDRGFAMIDLGSVHRIQRGMRFNVIRWRRNRWDRMGTVEVTKVFPTTSAVSIVKDARQKMVCPLTGFVGEPGMRYSPYAAKGDSNNEVVDLMAGDLEEVSAMNPLDPILTGDQITNPFYSRDRKLNFTIVGLPHEFSREELVTLIDRYGGNVLNDVTVETDYVVLCRIPDQSDPTQKALREASEAAQDQARQYGIPIMREIELLQLFHS